MEKKVYIRPLMTEVKIQANKLLAGSPDAAIYNEKSSNASYSRGSVSDWDDED